MSPLAFLSFCGPFQMLVDCVYILLRKKNLSDIEIKPAVPFHFRQRDNYMVVVFIMYYDSNVSALVKMKNSCHNLLNSNDACQYILKE